MVTHPAAGLLALNSTKVGFYVPGYFLSSSPAARPSVFNAATCRIDTSKRSEFTLSFHRIAFLGSPRTEHKVCFERCLGMRRPFSFMCRNAI